MTEKWGACLRCMGAGTRTYLTTPSDPEALVSEVARNGRVSIVYYRKEDCLSCAGSGLSGDATQYRQRELAKEPA